jgi:hypothetical protein
MEELEGVDLDAAMESVIDDMGRKALEFKARRYATKPSPEPKAPVEAPAQTENGPTLHELESMLGG